jgi:sigma-B regulation protein RsbU (phosphoserine phosphatase)
VRGGNGTIHSQVSLPGLRGVLYSRPCAGATGGDIHYLSVCGSGLMARVCLADVAGHGSSVAAIAAEMHAHLRRSVDVIDERKVLGRLNQRLNERGGAVMTTAVLATYYPPRRRLTVSYAGHPTGWLFRASTSSWAPLCAPVPAIRTPGLVDLPMGIGFTPTYSRHHFKVSSGDRMLLITDGVLETASPDDTPFDTHRIETLLNGQRGNCEDLARGLLAALHDHAACDELVHDDVTFLLAEFGDGPPGPALWHVFKHRVLRRDRR